MRFQTISEADTMEFGAKLGTVLQMGDAVLLSGDLGAGKSVLARGIARGLGITGAMPSPTFTIMIPYMGEKKLYHMDLYRLADPEEFYAAGLDEYIGGDGIAVVEWPEMADLTVSPAVALNILRGDGEQAREIEMKLIGMQIDLSALCNWRTDA